MCVFYIYIYIYIYIHTHTHTHTYMGVCMLITNIDIYVSQPMANLNPGLLSIGTKKKICLPEENIKFSTENRYNYIYNVPLVFCTTSCSIKTC